jgi:REP element-mobilizing transposase RayT
MREPYTQLYVHLVWATWDRAPLLSAARKSAVYECIQAECVALNADVITIGGVENHVHVLVRLPTTLLVAMLVKQVKGASSHLVTHKLTPGEGFKWQGAYGAFTISKAEVPRIRDYIVHQEGHHRNNTLYSDHEIG